MRARPTRFSDSTGLRLCGIAEEPFWPFGEELLRLQHFGALQMADFGGEPLDRGGDDAERGEKHGVAVARDDLRRDRLDRKPHLLGDMASTRGSTWAKVPTAPEIAQVATSLRAAPAARARGKIRHKATASLSPNVVGSAWMPCERPMVGVSLYSRARRSSASSSASTSAMRRSAARTSCTLKQVSSTSEEVMPDARSAPPGRRSRRDG